MKTFKWKPLFLFLIIIIAAWLRFWGLSVNPPSLTWDEAAWGYNAYSLGIDGRDEFGRFLPVSYLESFGDFKPPLYAYLSIIPVKIFGLNEFSTRFASAFLGLGTVFLTYFLVLEIFKDKKIEVIALISTFILAISPWHILLSRAAFEANVANFFIVLGVYLFLKAINSPNKWNIIFSFIAFVLSMYTFNTARIVSPLLVISLFLIKIKTIIKMKKQSVLAIIISVMIFLPLGLFLVTPQAKLRFDEVNIFSDIKVIERVNKEIENDNNSFFSKIIHNRRFAYGVEYAKHYFDNLNPLFLFINGDGNPKFSIQDVGEMYLWEMPFFIFGLLFLFKKKQANWWIIPIWLFLSIIPAATARETPHALRIESALPAFQIISAYGLYCFISVFKKNKTKYYVSFVLSILIIFNFVYFIHAYFVHYPKEFSNEWQYGYKDAISFIKTNEDKYNKVVFTQKLGRPYIYFLFYLKYSPQEFRNKSKIEREALGFVHVNSFDKYIFQSPVIKNNSPGEKILYVDVPGDVPEGSKIIKEFYLLDGQKSLIAYEL
ncbi:MAG: phospholipid carrier-dependent glycosyltransferase [Cyanobacteria bacterium]|nr:phospholipid carrier-dependent glycosyltransferase [Cyanobacteriota bacterium]